MLSQGLIVILHLVICAFITDR